MRADPFLFRLQPVRRVYEQRLGLFLGEYERLHISFLKKSSGGSRIRENFRVPMILETWRLWAAEKPLFIVISIFRA